MSKQTNWRAMQVPPHRVDRGAQPVWQKPGDILPRYLSMGSWTPRKLRRL